MREGCGCGCDEDGRLVGEFSSFFIFLLSSIGIHGRRSVVLLDIRIITPMNLNEFESRTKPTFGRVSYRHQIDLTISFHDEILYRYFHLYVSAIPAFG